MDTFKTIISEAGKVAKSAVKTSETSQAQVGSVQGSSRVLQFVIRRSWNTYFKPIESAKIVKALEEKGFSAAIINRGTVVLVTVPMG